MSQVSPGWYPDPDGRPCERYWNGTNWSLETRPKVGGAKAPVSQGGGITTGWKWAIGISLFLAAIMLFSFGSELLYLE